METESSTPEGSSDEVEVEQAEAMIEERLSDVKVHSEIAVAILEKLTRAVEVDREAGADWQSWYDARTEAELLWRASNQAVHDLLSAYRELADVTP